MSMLAKLRERLSFGSRRSVCVSKLRGVLMPVYKHVGRV